MAKQYYIPLLMMFLISFEVVVSTEVEATSQPSWMQILSQPSMPGILKEMVPKSSRFNYAEGKAKFTLHASINMYSYDYDLDTQPQSLQDNVFKSMFIHEDDLRVGATHKLQYLGVADNGPPFMSKQELKAKAPLKLENFTQILEVFSINPSSEEAQLMKFTLARCEHASKFGNHVCVPTLEDMVDYVKSEYQPSVLDVRVFGVEVTRSMEVTRRYRITDVKSAGKGSKIVSCHKATFPLGVFMCHHLKGRAYHVKLESMDNAMVKVNALVSCHHDTSYWSPKYGAFQILDLAPGQTVCHFLLGDSVLFTQPK